MSKDVCFLLYLVGMVSIPAWPVRHQYMYSALLSKLLGVYRCTQLIISYHTLNSEYSQSFSTASKEMTCAYLHLKHLTMHVNDSLYVCTFKCSKCYCSGIKQKYTNTYILKQNRRNLNIHLNVEILNMWPGISFQSK